MSTNSCARCRHVAQGGMDKSIIKDLKAYCEARGRAISTVCKEATGNSRLHERLPGKIAAVETDIARLRKFMAENPPND